MSKQLTSSNHSRDIAGLKYIYPVLSRRAGGLSIGVNVNTNNACNWRCIYCQVPDLIRGSAPEVDWDVLQEELRFFLQDVQQGDFYERYEVAAEHRLIKDIAISGNGEPTSVKHFERLISLIAESLSNADIKQVLPLVLITNGSLIHKENVQQGLRLLQQNNGQVWFKLDNALAQQRSRVNGASINQQQYINNLLTAASLCPTWIQSCVFSFDNSVWSDQELNAYLDLLADVMQKVSLQGVLLYSTARPSMQAEAPRIKACSAQQMQYFADQIAKLGLQVKVSL